MKYQDNSDNILIVPETMEGILKKFPLSKKVFWWLSVDNFYSARRGWEIEWIKKKLRRFGIEIRGDLFLEIKEKLGLFYDIKRSEIIHLVPVSYTHLDVYKRQVCTWFISKNNR